MKKEQYTVAARYQGTSIHTKKYSELWWDNYMRKPALFFDRVFAYGSTWVIILLAGAVVYESVKMHRLQSKIALADMVISAVNSAPPGMGAIIHVSRQN